MKSILNLVVLLLLRPLIHFTVLVTAVLVRRLVNRDGRQHDGRAQRVAEYNDALWRLAVRLLHYGHANVHARRRQRAVCRH